MAEPAAPSLARFWRHGLQLWCLVTAFACLTRPAQAAITPEEDAALRRGGVVTHILRERGPGGRLVAAIDIPAKSSAVWAVLLDCERAPFYVPGLAACRILETGADGSFDIREHKIRWIALLPRLTLRFRSDYRPLAEIRVTRISGDLAALQGVWRLEPLDEGRVTRLHYDFKIVPNNFLPAGLVRSGLMRDTPKVLEAVRAEVARNAH